MINYQWNDFIIIKLHCFSNRFDRFIINSHWRDIKLSTCKRYILNIVNVSIVSLRYYQWSTNWNVKLFVKQLHFLNLVYNSNRNPASVDFTYPDTLVIFSCIISLNCFPFSYQIINKPTNNLTISQIVYFRLLKNPASVDIRHFEARWIVYFIKSLTFWMFYYSIYQ